MAKEHIKQLQKHRVRFDRRVTVAITMVGWLVLVMLLVMIWHLFSVTRPILKTPSFELDYQITPATQNPIIEIAHLDNTHWQFTLTSSCDLEVFSSDESNNAAVSVASPQPGIWFPHHCAARQKLIWAKEGIYWLKLSDAGILRVFTFNQNTRRFDNLVFSRLLSELMDVDSLEKMQVTVDKHHLVMLAQEAAGFWRFIRFDMHDRERQLQLDIPETLNISSSADSSGAKGQFDHPSQDFRLLPDFRLLHMEKLDLVYSSKQLLLLEHAVSQEEKQDRSTWNVFRDTNQADILALTSLSTQRSFLLVNDNLELEKWSLLNQNGETVLQKVYVLPLQGEGFKGIHHVKGDLVVVLMDADAWFVNATTGEVLNVDTHQLTFDKAWFTGESVVFERKGTLVTMKIADAEATTSFERLLGKVWYDGYPQPDYVWQTSSASDESQAKYSLVPLLMGSVKAAFLALIVAIPLAIGSAIYSGYYAAPKIRKVIKPYIEVLEAIPSVVIGFIAVIWLLPVSESYLLATILFFLLTPVFLVLFVWINNTGRHLGVAGWELTYFAVVLVLYIATFQLLMMDEHYLLRWVLSSEAGAQINIELKTTFVLALALGIAIVPTVFTIAEDAIHQVPRSLPMASFALGANRSQTLVKIVLKVAMPGIVSAIMLGFARAVGETMIVLMVSGNTPVADWGLLEGIRTMTANLAIELPEAQPGSTHYQILFLVALLLFLFTFVFNTLAEFLRTQLRNRYKM